MRRKSVGQCRKVEGETREGMVPGPAFLANEFDVLFEVTDPYAWPRVWTALVEDKSRRGLFVGRVRRATHRRRWLTLVRTP